MAVRLLAAAALTAACFAVVPTGPANAPESRRDLIATDRPFLPSASFDDLIRTDPVAAFEVALARYRSEFRGFTATLQKQERIGNRLHPVETIRVAVREDPFAVKMIWLQGARNQAEGSYYAVGENGGAMKVWRPNALFAKSLTVDPKDGIARAASRYCITESSLYHGLFRTFDRWRAAKAEGVLHVEYLGRKPVPETGNRLCHIWKRTCTPPEADPFSQDEPAPKKPSPNDAFTTVLIAIDAETWIQAGAELRHANGELIGSYYFRDVVLNPSFAPGTFSGGEFRKP